MAPGINVCRSCGRPLPSGMIRLEKTKLLVVEGEDDFHFFRAFLDRMGIQDVQVVGSGGKTKLAEYLAGVSKDDFFQDFVYSLGIVRDADDSPDGAFQSVCGALEKANLPVPVKPMKPKSGIKQVSVMILPFSNKKGALENLCLEAVVADPAIKCVDDYFKCLSQQGANGPNTKDDAKARVKVFLASREDPTLPVGRAAQKGYWPFDNKAFAYVAKFLKQL
jgi:hypothetical protein